MTVSFSSFCSGLAFGILTHQIGFKDPFYVCKILIVFYSTPTQDKDHKGWDETVEISDLSLSGQCQDYTMEHCASLMMLGIIHKYDHRHWTIGGGSLVKGRGSLQKLTSKEKVDEHGEQDIFHNLWQSPNWEQESLKKCAGWRVLTRK